MEKKGAYLLLLFIVICFNACKKEIRSVGDADICLHNSTLNYQKKWAAVFTQIDIYGTTGAKKSTIIPAYGYFSINFNSTYELYTDAEPSKGTWIIDKDCRFVLKAKGSEAHIYTVKKLTVDSLVISETVGNVVNTSHYATFKCPEIMSMEYRWDNVATITVRYGAISIYDAQIKYPTGYIKFNTDATYNLLSNDVPYKGTWGITQPDCILVLDKSRSWEKSYQVQKLTADSLKLWYKDTVAKMNYLLLYKRH